MEMCHELTRQGYRRSILGVICALPSIWGRWRCRTRPTRLWRMRALPFVGARQEHDRAEPRGAVESASRNTEKLRSLLGCSQVVRDHLGGCRAECLDHRSAEVYFRQ